MTALTLGHEFFFAEWSVWRKYFNFTWSPFQIIIGGHFTLEQVNIAAIRVVPTPIISKDSELVDPNWVSGWATQITVSLLNELTLAQWKLNNKWGRTFYISKILHKIFEVSDMKSLEWGLSLSCGCHFHYVHLSLASLSLLAVLPTARNVLSLLPLILTFAWMCKTWSVRCLIRGVIFLI